MLRKLAPAILALFLTAWASLVAAPIALAQSNIIGGGVFGDVKKVSVGPPVLTFQGTVTGSTSTNTATFTNLPIGTPGLFTNRRVIIAFTANNGFSASTISSVSGMTATTHFSANNGSYIGLISGNVAVGTTVTITVTWNSTLFSTPVAAVYTVDDALLISTTPSIGGPTNSAGSVSSLTSGSFTQATGGFTIGVGALGAANTALAITGFATNFGGGTSQGIVSSQTGVAPGSSTITMTWGSAASGETIAAASWR